jgi:hypothetical protein
MYEEAFNSRSLAGFLFLALSGPKSFCFQSLISCLYMFLPGVAGKDRKKYREFPDCGFST